MELNEVYYGFKLNKKEYIKEIDVTLNEFTHVQSGATLAYLECDDTNKTFMAAFRTLPEDSTGVCHILEHSVLCGSKKYPLKEPFVNLIKGSMASFLNAMTASDFTCYPVASKNDKDFNNLMSLYLDAVFSPLSVTDEKPFLQEGWHYEMNSEDDIPSIKGVVYNEMKGAMSSVDSMLDSVMRKVMYNGTGYSFNSGGDPDVIPKLTFEYYKKYYHTHYHPENAILVLYGKMNILEKLEFIDKEYLSLFKIGGNKTKIPMPKPVVDTNYEEYYPIGESESEENNTYMSLTFALPECSNIRDYQAFEIIRSALFETNDSPLKKALIDANLGKDIDVSIDNDCILPNFQISLKGTNKELKKKFYDTFIGACKDIVNKGINRDVLLATINNAKFKYKEMDMGTLPKGVIFAFTLMPAFLYELPLADVLKMEQHFDFYKENLKTSYFEDLIEKYFINSKHYVLVTLLPSSSMAKEKEDMIAKEMKKLKESMSKAEVLSCIKQTRELQAYQERHDTEEELASLPTLELSDISLDINTIPTKKYIHNSYQVLEHEFNTNQIAYLTMLFDLKSLTIEELKYAKVLAVLLKMLNTKNMDAYSLQNYIKTYLGDLVFSVYLSAKDDTPVAKMAVFASALKENVSYISNAISSIITGTIFDKEKVLVLLHQMKMDARENIIQGGTGVATCEAAASFSKAFKLNSACQGKNIYDFVTNAIENVDEFIEKIKDISSKIFTNKDLIISASGDRETIDSILNVVDNIKLEEYNGPEALCVELDSIKQNALIIPSEVNYDGMALDFNSIGYKLDGTFNVLSHIVSYDYLWPQVRVMGGAYGCNFTPNIRQNIVILGSYRDPNIMNTYDVYNNIPNYLEEFAQTEAEFKSYLIGAIGGLDQPVSNTVLINTCDKYMLLGITDESRIKIKKEMLETTVEKIQALAPIFRDSLSNASIYAVGSKNDIATSKMFKDIKEL